MQLTLILIKAKIYNNKLINIIPLTNTYIKAN